MSQAMARRLVYLDHAAATPVDPGVMKAMQPFFSDKFYNPAASYEQARECRAAIEEAKAKIARLMGVKPAELVLTSGGTEANNLAVWGIMSQFPDKKVLVSSIEHESVLEPARRWHCQELAVDPTGVLDIEKAIQKIDDDTVMISVMLANNEVGALQPVRSLAQKIEALRHDRLKRKIKTPLFFHTDGAQAPLHLDIHAHRLGVDMMSVNGGKIYGPKQSGALYVRAGLTLKPIIVGGGQQRGIRSGTESPAAAVGLAEALEVASQKRPSETKRLGELQKYFCARLASEFPASIINGPLKKRLPNNVHVTFPGVDNERTLYKLDSQGVLAAAGSACSAASVEPSHVLKAMGLSESHARSSLRLTMGRATTKADIDYAIRALAAALT